jgi:hypothetical protein
MRPGALGPIKLESPVMGGDERPNGPRIEPWVAAPIVIALLALAWMAFSLLRR